MRKTKLLLLALMAMLGVSVHAQSWTAPEITGEAPQSGGTYYLKNVGANAYVTGGKVWFGWNTTALLTADKANALAFKVTETSSGVYTLQRTSDNKYFFISGNNITGNAMHVDGGANEQKTFSFSLQSGGTYRIQAAQGNNYYNASLYMGYATDGTMGLLASVDPTSSDYTNKCDWQFISTSNEVYNARLNLYNELLKAYADGTDYSDASDVYENVSATATELTTAYTSLHAARYQNALAAASDSDPREITEWVLTNADFSAGNINGWETNYVSGQQAQNIGYQGASYSNGAVTINKFIEAWRPGATLGDGYLRQTVSGLPEGKYVLEADGISVWQNNENQTVTGSQIYITADGVDYYKDMSTKNNKPEHFSVQFLNTGEGDVIFGLRTVSSNGNWLCADNFKVTFYGIDLSAYETQLATEVENFNNLKDNLDATTKTALETQVNELNIAYTSSKTYAAAIANMQTINAYAAALIAANAAKDDATYANVTGTELTALNTAIGDTPTFNDYTTYADKTTALTTATSDFTAAAASYEAFNLEKTHAMSLGVTEFPTPNSGEEALTGINTLKVAEHNAVISKYTTDGSALFIPSWDQEGFGESYVTEHWSGVNHEYFDKNGSNFSCKLYKTVTLPQGHYVFYAAARGAANATATIKVTIDGTTTEVPCTTKGNTGYGINTSGDADFSPSSTYANNNAGFGWEWRHAAFDLDEEKEVTLAIECGAGSSWAWVSACDTRLVTYDNIAVSKNLYETVLAEAIAARDNSDYANIAGEERTGLENAINATPTTKEEYENATTALEDAILVFTAAKANYDNYAAYRAETVAAFGEELAATVADPTTAAEALTAIQNLNIAQYNKVADDYTFSCSGLIGDFGSWEGTATVNDVEAEPNYLDWEHWSGTYHAYYEQAANGWGSNSWTIQYQKTCSLPAGNYVIKVAARSSAGTTSRVTCTATDVIISLPNVGSPGRGINTSGIASWSNEDEFANGNLNNGLTPSVGGNGTGWQWRFLPFTLTAETEVTMTFYAEANSQYQWMSIADGELLSTTKLAEDVAYNDADENTIEDKPIADVTITRNIKVGYNTVVLPFDLTANQVAAAFGSGTVVYTFEEDSDDPSNCTINFEKGDGSITANTPVVIEATLASNEQTFEGVKIVAANSAIVSGKNFDFVGTYEPTTVAKGDYFISGKKIYKSAGNTSINAFRAFIQGKTSEARIANFVIGGGETTGIADIENMRNVENGKIYNLSGQHVAAPTKGIFIKNGKKVVIK